MKLILKTALLIVIVAICYSANAQTAVKTKKQQPAENNTLTSAQKNAQKQAKIKKLIAEIDLHPGNMNAHGDYIYLAGWDDTLLKKNYETWMQKSSFSANVLLQLGWKAGERPEAKGFFQKALAADSTRAEIWNALATATSIAGDKLIASEYYKQAADLSPKNADYASSYMYSLKNVDPNKYNAMLAGFEDRFPRTIRGAQSLYWLAQSEPDTLKRIMILERSNAEYHLANEWSVATELYGLYLQTEPQKAVVLANSYHWTPKAIEAQKIILIKQLSAEKKYNEALAVIDSLEQMKNLYKSDLLTNKKIELYNLVGAPRTAYDTLMKKMIKMPTAQTHGLLMKYGEKIGKHESDVNADWLTMMQMNAKMAPVFSSQLFTSDERISLTDYRGKVVLLTFWFPGCGPCRAEFPHFENVLKKFSRDKVAYLGVNALPDQNGNVLSVVEKDKLTFTPLHGTQKAEQLYKFGLYPANFLIDKQGRVIFRDFRIGDDNEDTLELMINLILNKDKNILPLLIADTMKKN